MPPEDACASALPSENGVGGHGRGNAGTRALSETALSSRPSISEGCIMADLALGLTILGTRIPL